MRMRYLILPVADQSNGPGTELLPKDIAGLKNLQSFVGRLNSYGRKTYSELLNKKKNNGNMHKIPSPENNWGL